MSILRDGIKTYLVFAGIDRNLFGEVEITPPGVTGRGAIDMVGTRNLAWATQAPKSIKNLTPVTGKLMFDPLVIPSVWAIIQKNRQFNVQFPNAFQLVFWGWFEEMTFDPLSEGNRPIINFNIQPSNLNNECNESGPTWVPGGANLCA